MITLPLPKIFQNWFKNLNFYIFTSKFIYIMQSDFKNKVLLPKKTCEIHFITSLNLFLVALT
jgi:hypothetical protein